MLLHFQKCIESNYQYEFETMDNTAGITNNNNNINNNNT